MLKRLIVCLFTVTALPGFSDPLKISFSSGTAYNAPSTLLIKKEQPIRIPNAEFSTRYISPLYSVTLATNWLDENLDFEWHHHKVVLEDPNGNSGGRVEQFQLTNGYNMLTMNYSVPVPWLLRWLGSEESLRFGLGTVVGYPLSKIDGVEFDRQGSFCLLRKCGFFMSGGVGQLSWVHLWSVPLVSRLTRLSIRTELKATLSGVTAPVTHGYAVMRNIAYHAYLGLQFGF